MLKPAVEDVLALLLPERELSLVNVNFPDRKPKGLCWTRQSVRHYDGKVVPGQDPMGRRLYWFTVIPIEETEEGTDRWAVEQGYVSMTPLRLDLTNEVELQQAKARHPLE
jgi:5'-nucleotidase